MVIAFDLLSGVGARNNELKQMQSWRIKEMNLNSFVSELIPIEYQ